MTERKSRTAVLMEASLLLAVLFLGTNPVAVKIAVAEVPAALRGDALHLGGAPASGPRGELDLN